MTGLPLRVLTVLLAILATLALVGCGSNGPSQAELDAQDRKVIALAQKQQAHARIVMAVRAKNAAIRAQKRAAAARAKRAQKRYRVIIREVPVTPSISGSGSSLCGPIQGGGPLSKKERKLRRRQALYFLNLHCGSR
jgi:predicted small lipoprotein YifL